MKTRSLRPVLVLIAIASLFVGPVLAFSAGEETPGSVRSTKAYIVKEGDTLWGISGRFLGSPYEWSKVWERNPSIKNPHLIYPGDHVFLYTEVSPVPAVERPLPRPEHTGLPASHARADQQSSRAGEIVADGVISDEEVQKVGTVVGARDDRELLAQDDLVYVQFKRDEDIEIGERYAIVRVGRMLYHPRDGSPLGRMYSVLGQVELLEHQTGKAAAGRIVSSRDVIRVGDAVHVPVSHAGQPAGAPAQRPLEGYVVCAAADHEEIAQHDIVFVTLGSQDGLEVGNELLVLDQGKAVEGFEGRGTARLPDETIARLLVLRTGPKVSTAVVEDSHQTFSSGAVIRTPVSHPSAP